MTIFDIAVPAIAASIAGGLYLYLWNERRKLHADRKANPNARG
ncbi:hypothetical protein SAMN02927924_01438 [Sphingobium faniae]|nr:hypothetical protein SAMN02927924_01438 [Sphingobium faniae]